MEDSRASGLPGALMIAALALAGGLVLVLTWDMTFYQDTWVLLLERREITADNLFLPQNEHIVVIPMLIELILVRAFGMTSALPEYLLLAIGLLGTATLLFVYLRRRVGDWFALFAAALVLFLGPAWEVLLWPFEIGFVGSVLCGLAALLCLERGDRRGDVAACALLTLAAGFSSLGIPFLVGAAVAIGLGPKERWRGRAYVVAVPVLLFAAWYLGWGHEAVSHLSFKNALSSPRYVAEMAAANLGSVFGLGPNPATGALGRGPNPEVGLDPVWGRLILGALVVGFAIRQWRGASLSPRFWPVAAIALTNWFLTALNQFPGREPTNSRYQYAGAIFALMLIASVFDGAPRPKRGMVAAAGVATVLAIAPNLVVLGNGADFLDEQSVLTRADTAALEIARETVDPEFQLTPAVAGTPTLPNVFAGKYFAATAEHGSPAYTPAELEAAPEAGRFQADVVLANALPISNAIEPGFAASADSACAVQPAGPKTEVALAPGTTRIELAAGPDASFALRRFAVGEYPVQTEGVQGRSVSELTIPADAVSTPWQLLVEAEQEVRVCR